MDKIIPYLKSIVVILNYNIKHIFKKMNKKEENNEENKYLNENNSFDILMNYLSSISCYRNICLCFKNGKILFI